MTLKYRAMDQAGISGEVFDSNSFDTSAFDINSWDFGDVVIEQRDPGGYTGFVRDLREEEELLIIIQSFLSMRNH